VCHKKKLDDSIVLWRWENLPKTLIRVGCTDVEGQIIKGGARGETLNMYSLRLIGPLMGWVKPHAGGVP
jgi:hypothetical protein